MNALLDEVRLDDIEYDPFGTSMLWLGAIADESWWEGEPVPSEWGYRPAMGQGAPDPDDYRASRVHSMLLDGEVSMADLLAAGRVLDRYIDVLKADGRSY